MICGFGCIDSVCWCGSFLLDLLTLVFGFGSVIWWVLIFELGVGLVAIR